MRIDDDNLIAMACVCGRVFKSDSGLSNHRRVCDGEVLNMEHQCGSCLKVLKTAAGLRLHKKSRRRRDGEEVESHPCDRCGMVCRTLSGLSSHRRHCTGEEKKKTTKSRKRKATESATVEDLTCVLCNRVFKTRGGLSNHRRTCGAVGCDYSCMDCNKRFKSERGLNVHVRYCQMPDGEKMKCEHCDRLFCTSAGCRLHMKRCLSNVDRVVAEKVDCSVCGKKYTVRGMPVHMRKSHPEDVVGRRSAVTRSIDVNRSHSQRTSVKISKKYDRIVKKKKINLKNDVEEDLRLSCDFDDDDDMEFSTSVEEAMIAAVAELEPATKESAVEKAKRELERTLEFFKKNPLMKKTFAVDDFVS